LGGTLVGCVDDRSADSWTEIDVKASSHTSEHLIAADHQHRLDDRE
jgi:hypothetical protein